MYKTIVILALFAVLAAIFPAAHSSAKTYTGKCGPNAYWTIDSEAHIVTITGTGMIEGSIGWCKNKKEKSAIYRTTIKKIIFSEGITDLNIAVFSPGSYNLQQSKIKIRVILPDSLQSIQKFSGSDRYKWNITIPKNVKELTPHTAFLFAEDSWDTTLKVAAENPYFCSVDGVIFSKNKKKLVYYYPRKKQKKYMVPDTVTAIAPLAFCKAYNLRRIILPDGLQELGSGAFFGCENLRYLNLSHKMKIKSITDYPTRGEWVADETYFECQSNHYEKHSKYHKGEGCHAATEDFAGTFEGTQLRSITIPNSVEYLSSNSLFLGGFHTLTGLHKIKFGKNFSGDINLGESQDGMKTLTLNGAWFLKIVMPQENEKYCLEDGILYSKDKSILYLVTGEYKAESLNVPESVTTIANGALASNENVKHVIISGDMESIGYNAFAESKIETFTCRGKIKTLGQNAFADCLSLKKITIQEIQEIPDSAFIECSYMKTAYFGTEVKTIDNAAFNFCDALKTVEFGERVMEIGSSAFYHCIKLVHLRMNHYVCKIDEGAFFFCVSLAEEDIPEINPVIARFYRQNQSAAFLFGEKDYLKYKSLFPVDYKQRECWKENRNYYWAVY